MKQRISLLLTLLLILSLLAVPVSASTDIVEPTEQLYVADYANILSTETEQTIVEQVTALKGLCGGEIAVVTIDFLNDLDAEEYAYEIINQWGVGDKDKQNGMVLLLVPGEGKGWCTVGSGLEKYISADTLDSILNAYLWDDFDAGNYDRAVRNTFAQLLAQYESYYGIDVEGAASNAYQEDYYYEEPQPRRPFVRALVEIFVVLIIFSILFGGRHGRRRLFFFPFFGGFWHRRPPRDDWRGPGGPGPRGPRGPGSFGGGGFGGGSFGGGGGRGGGAGRR